MIKRFNWFKIHSLRKLTFSPVFLLFLFIWNASLFAVQISSFDLPGKSTGNLVFHLDVYQFQGQDNKTKLEVSYSIDLSQYSIPDTLNDSIKFQIKLEVKGSRIDNFLNLEKIKTVTFDPENGNGTGYLFVDLERFSLKPDTVRLYFAISDTSNHKKGIVKYKFRVKKFTNDLSVSDIVFIKHIQRSQDQSPFTRQGVLMIPNPSRLYNITESNQFVFFYFQINNLSSIKDQPSAYSFFYEIHDLAGNEVLTKNYESLPVSASNTSRVEKIDLHDFSTGVYKFKAFVTDLKSAETVQIQKYFRVHSSIKTAELILPMTEEDIEKYYDQIKYIASEVELKVFKSLDPQGKQLFLLKFWEKRDPNPETPENEFMIEHFTKIDYCEEHFKDGINSDMGRIYVIYGPPLDIKRIVSTTEFTKPVEIWIYALEGHSEFVFVDRLGGDQYVLVHSNHPDEYQNPGWESDLE